MQTKQNEFGRIKKVTGTVNNGNDCYAKKNGS